MKKPVVKSCLKSNIDMKFWLNPTKIYGSSSLKEIAARGPTNGVCFSKGYLLRTSAL